LFSFKKMILSVLSVWLNAPVCKGLKSNPCDADGASNTNSFEVKYSRDTFWRSFGLAAGRWRIPSFEFNLQKIRKKNGQSANEKRGSVALVFIYIYIYLYLYIFIFYTNAAEENTDDGRVEEEMKIQCFFFVFFSLPSTAAMLDTERASDLLSFTGGSDHMDQSGSV
jgi:hypothetical protein